MKRGKSVRTSCSRKAFEEASRLLPCGVNSLSRYHAPYPIFAERGEGSTIFDLDGNSYIDYLLGYGSLVLGHKHPKIVEAIENQLKRGTMFCCPHDLSSKVAKKVVKFVPSIDKVFFTNTGSEAILNAIRLARSRTGKDKIVKFEGQYHGSSDCVLLNLANVPLNARGAGLKPRKMPASAGMLKTTLDYTIVLPWNNAELLEETVRTHQSEIAAVITDPIMTGCGVIEPKKGYLRAVRKITQENEILLIFDEIVTGFRVALGGAQEIYGIRPDITVLSKALGGGVPIAAVGGKKTIMDDFSPGKVRYSGTYNGNPLVLASALATLEELESGALRQLNSLGKELLGGMKDIVDDMRVEAIIQGQPSVFQIYFTNLEEVKDAQDMFEVDLDKYARFHKSLLDRGVFSAYSAFERYNMSAVHKSDDLHRTLAAFEATLKLMN